jgi:hypothetical protein
MVQQSELGLREFRIAHVAFEGTKDVPDHDGVPSVCKYSTRILAPCPSLFTSITFEGRCFLEREAEGGLINRVRLIDLVETN